MKIMNDVVIFVTRSFNRRRQRFLTETENLSGVCLRCVGVRICQTSSFVSICESSLHHSSTPQYNTEQQIKRGSGVIKCRHHVRRLNQGLKRFYCRCLYVKWPLHFLLFQRSHHHHAPAHLVSFNAKWQRSWFGDLLKSPDGRICVILY